ncbi:MAG TPA: hypothetical protein VGJ28_16170 [Micromonosporaceae bacterium]|jgi:hypothetical protein
MFGRHATETPSGETLVEERPDQAVADDTLVDEKTAEAREDEAAREGAEEQAESDNTQRISTRPVVTTAPPPVVTEPDVVEEPVKTGWAHVSLTASLSLVIGTLAIAATLTGLLAPLGFAAGILAVLLGFAALVGVRRNNVTGHGLMVFGIVFGLIAVVLSMLAMGGQLSWLSNKTDEIATVHTWLNDHFHWLRRW